MYIHREILIGNNEFGFTVDSSDWGLDAQIDRDWNGEALRFVKVGPFAFSWNSFEYEESDAAAKTLGSRYKAIVGHLATKVALVAKMAASDSPAARTPLPPQRPRGISR